MITSSSAPVGSHLSLWGEGPIWHGDFLYYVDIEAHKIVRFHPASGEEKFWSVGERVGTVVKRTKGGLVYAGDEGISFLNEETGAMTPVADPETDLPNNRFNDGKCDPAGRFWAGTIHLAPKREPIAALYCLYPDLHVEKKFSPVTNSNGIVWTRNTRTMYYIDTPRKSVLAFDFDNATGSITHERVAFSTEACSGNPDGMTIDAEDRLWIAFCHGGAVRCFDPLTGLIQAEVMVPCVETTACAFGGPDLSDLYITTGRHATKVEPLAGRLFVARPGAVGVPSHSFAG
jgi:sugar lactone lactonase YvrE